MEKIKAFIKKNMRWQLAAAIVIGAIVGYAYYYFIGCQGGTCAITSNPYNSTLYGVLFGFVIGLK